MDEEFLFANETHELISCAFEVINGIGHGFHEKPYENALIVEFQQRKIDHTQQAHFPLNYKGVKVSEYIPDIIAFGKIIIDTKVIHKITDHEIGQMLNYLKISGLKVGLILNFKRAKLEYRRVILEDQKPPILLK